MRDNIDRNTGQKWREVMASCTFFGHKECEIDNPIDKLLPVLANLIMNKGVDTFYVGNQGDFDKTVLIVLRRFQTYFTHIKFSVVLAYHPFVKPYSDFLKAEETVFPEELENIHPRFAISKRNEWMISKSDYAVVFVKRPVGGAAKYKELAEKKGLTVINLHKDR